MVPVTTNQFKMGIFLNQLLETHRAARPRLHHRTQPPSQRPHQCCAPCASCGSPETEISERPMAFEHAQIIHVWYIYLQNWVIYGANVGKYTIHG